MSLIDHLRSTLGYMRLEPEPLALEVSRDDGKVAWSAPAIVEELPFHFLIPTTHRCQVCGGITSCTSRRARYCYHQDSEKGKTVPEVLVRPITRGMDFWEAVVQAPLAVLVPPGFDGFRVRLLPSVAGAA